VEEEAIGEMRARRGLGEGERGRRDKRGGEGRA
jgi:hypothetical protein